MRPIFSIFLTVLFFQSCLHKNDSNKPDFKILNACNEVTVVYYNRNDTLTYKARDTSELEILTELISGRQDEIANSCMPAGQLIYKSNGQTVFDAAFSTTGTNVEFDCNYVVYESGDKTYRHKLTYRAGRLLDEIIWTIRSSTLKIDTDSIKFLRTQ